LGFVHEQANVYTYRMSHNEELRDRPHPMQIEIWKKMSSLERFQLSESLRLGAIELRKSVLRKKPFNHRKRTEVKD